MSGGARAKGKGSERKKNKRRHSNKERCRHSTARRTTETAPHILAALEAQRARASQRPVPAPQHQASPAPAPPTDTPPQPLPASSLPPPPALPGYLFDPARNRFFRAVKDSLGTPSPIAQDIGGRGGGGKMRRKLKIPIVLGRDETSRMPPPLPPRAGGGSGSWERRNDVQGIRGITKTNIGGGSSSSSSSSSNGVADTRTTGCSSGCTGAQVRNTAARRSGGLTFSGKGLHSYAMDSRRGFLNWDARAGAPRAASAGIERARRAAIESVVSSSRFRLRSLPAWAHTAPGAAYSAIDWNARRGVLAVGTNSGALGMMATGNNPAIGGGGGGGGGSGCTGCCRRCGCRDGDGGGDGVSGGNGGQVGRVSSSRRGGLRGGEAEGRVCWGSAASRSSSQVSDIKFREQGNEWACATASLGCGGEPGGVNTRFWREEGQGEARDVVDIFANARGCETKLWKGSVWCTEWDPSTPTRLAIGPSSCSPVAFFDFEKQRSIPVAKLSSDTFSMSFLPPAAPGAGHAFVCGLRDGSVVLVDPRQPLRQNGKITVADSLPRGRGPTSDGVRGNNSRVGSDHGRGRCPNPTPNTLVGGGGGAATAAAAAQSLLVRLDCSSIDHTHILRDGTRCVVKDRSGGLQAVDLRLCTERGQGSGGDRGRGRAPRLKVLVPPSATGTRRAPVPGRFVLDPTETIVLTPVAAATPVGSGGGGGGGGGGAAAVAGGGERPSPRAWDAFGSSTPGLRHRNSGEAGSADSISLNGGGGGDRSFAAEVASGDRIRIVNVSSGEVLNDIPTPWTGVSLARGSASTLAGAGGIDSCRCHGGDTMRFWGSAWEPGRGAAVFEARLGAEATGGHGR